VSGLTQPLNKVLVHALGDHHEVGYSSDLGARCASVANGPASTATVIMLGRTRRFVARDKAAYRGSTISPPGSSTMAQFKRQAAGANHTRDETAVLPAAL